ncbi:MAG: cupin domain-containing protein [Promethearchaeota archaeon]
MKLTEIHSDKRGKICLLEGDLQYHQEVTVFITKAGFLRGGCIHNLNDEFSCIIEGEVLYRLKNKIIKCKKGDSILIPKGTPHYFQSVTDSIVLEWGATPEEKKGKYPEFRKIVERLNKENEIKKNKN